MLLTCVNVPNRVSAENTGIGGGPAIGCATVTCALDVNKGVPAGLLIPSSSLLCGSAPSAAAGTVTVICAVVLPAAIVTEPDGSVPKAAAPMSPALPSTA